VKFNLQNKTSYIFRPVTVPTKIYIVTCSDVSFKTNVPHTNNSRAPRGPTAPPSLGTCDIGWWPHQLETLLLTCSKQRECVNLSCLAGKCFYPWMYVRCSWNRRWDRGTLCKVGSPVDDDTSSSEDVAPSQNIDLSCRYQPWLSSAVSAARGVKSDRLRSLKRLFSRLGGFLLVQLLHSIAGTGSSSPLFVIIFKVTEPVHICNAGSLTADLKPLFVCGFVYKYECVFNPLKPKLV
jgi:hypothetical protein